MNDLKQTETHLRKLVNDARNGKRGLFAIATCCATLLNERAAYAEMLHIDESEVADHLTETYLQDFAVDALELQALLTHYPRAEQWNKPLRDLLFEAKKSAKKHDDRSPRSRRAVTLKEHEKLQKERDSLQSQVTYVQGRLDLLHSENQELRAENARLKGRLEELERVLDKTIQKRVA